jgi:hypothetical protein
MVFHPADRDISTMTQAAKTQQTHNDTLFVDVMTSTMGEALWRLKLTPMAAELVGMLSETALVGTLVDLAVVLDDTFDALVTSPGRAVIQ